MDRVRVMYNQAHFGNGMQQLPTGNVQLMNISCCKPKEPQKLLLQNLALWIIYGQNGICTKSQLKASGAKELIN